MALFPCYSKKLHGFMEENNYKFMHKDTHKVTKKEVWYYAKTSKFDYLHKQYDKLKVENLQK